MRFQVLCRGSVQHGLGHLLRSTTFVNDVCDGHEVELVALTEPSLDSLLDRARCPVRIVREETEFVEPVSAFDPETLVFDMTHVETDVFARLGNATTTRASISPVFSEMKRVDIRFTRTNTTPPLEGVKTWGGLEYAIFNDHCHRLDASTYARSLETPEFPIAICMGGTDAANKTLRVLRRVVEFQGPLTIWVLLGEGYAHPYAELVETVKRGKRHEVILAKTNRSMWRILSNCALAILAGGLTTVEAAYAGLPTINLFEKQWQARVMSPELFEAGVALDGGVLSNGALDSLLRRLEELHSDRDALLRMHMNTHGLLDDRAAERILDRIEDFHRTRTGRG